MATQSAPAADEAALLTALHTRGLIDSQAVAEACAERARSGERPLTWLVRSGRIDGEAMAAAISAMIGVPPATSLTPAPGVARQVNSALLARRAAMLVTDGADGLVAAMADPTDSETLAALEFATGRPVAPRVAPLGAIEQALGLAPKQPPPPRAASLFERASPALTPALIDRIADACADAGGLRAGIAALSARARPAEQAVLARLTTRGESASAMFAGEPRIDAGALANAHTPAETAEVLRAVAGRMRAAADERAALVAAFVPAAAWVLAASALFAVAGALWLAAGLAGVGGLVARAIRQGLAIAGDDRPAAVRRWGGWAQASGIGAFAVAVAMLVRG